MMIHVEGGTYMIRGNQASGPERIRVPGRGRESPVEQELPEQR